MALKNYGVLKGVPTHYCNSRSPGNHYQIRMDTMDDAFRIAVDFSSGSVQNDLYGHIIPDFAHPVLDLIKKRHFGFTPLPTRPGSGALDYLRGNLFDINNMLMMPGQPADQDNDLNELFDFYIQKAIVEKGIIYAFGERWFPETSDKKDHYYPGTPDQGVRNVRMNQGCTAAENNGVWQDGGMLIYFPLSGLWTAIFLKFGSQALYTDNRTGEPVAVNHPFSGQSFEQEEKPIRIVAAYVNPSGEERGKEKIMLFNPTNKAIDLTNCVLTNNAERILPLDIQMAPGAVHALVMPGHFPLSNKGGVINLLDANGKKMHGVQYSKADVKKENHWVVF